MYARPGQAETKAKNDAFVDSMMNQRYIIYTFISSLASPRLCLCFFKNTTAKCWGNGLAHNTSYSFHNSALKVENLYSTEDSRYRIFREWAPSSIRCKVPVVYRFYYYFPFREKLYHLVRRRGDESARLDKGETSTTNWQSDCRVESYVYAKKKKKEEFVIEILQ